MRRLRHQGPARRRYGRAHSWLGIALLAGLVVPVHAGEEEPPPGVEQLLPRGQIAAIDGPEFVSAAAAEIPDDAWVLGVVVAGEAKAYSLNLLNRHEVVNDQSGEVPYAAVW